MRTVTTLLLGMALGAFGMTAAGAVPVGPADEATKNAVAAVKRGIVAGHKAEIAPRSIGCMPTTTRPSIRKARSGPNRIC